MDSEKEEYDEYKNKEEIKNKTFTITKQCRKCHEWLDSSKFHCFESLICRKCQLVEMSKFTIMRGRKNESSQF